MIKSACLTSLLLGALLSLPAGCQPSAAKPGVTAVPEKVEVVEEHWPNGKLRLRREVTRAPDDTLVDEGRYTRWYDNGQKEYEGVFVHGKPDGVATSWHCNGLKWIEEHYVQGQREGVRLDWDENGILRKEEHFSEDKPDGTWSTWDAKGKLKTQQKYEKGVPQS